MVYVIAILGDRAQALLKILHLVESMLEGLRSSPLMYLCLIWLRIFCYVLKNPKGVKKKLNPMLTSFGDFVNNPTRDKYVEGLMNDMSELTVTPKKQYTAKRKLSELADSDDSEPDMAYVASPVSSNDEGEMPQPPKEKENPKTQEK